MEQTVDKTILYAAEVAPLEEQTLFTAALQRVSPQRREKASRLRQPGDRRLSLAAELLLRYGMETAGECFDPAALCVTEYGKLYFPEGRLQFSLSHSGTWALCALSEREVGCDVEQMRRVDLRICRRFAPEEQAHVLSTAEETEQQRLFFRYWTLKESFMKATGLGMRLPLRDFRILPGDEIAVEQQVDDRQYRFREFDGIPGCCCAVCTVGAPMEAELRIVPIRELLAGDA